MEGGVKTLILFLWKVELVIFSQSNNSEFSKKCPETLMLHRSELNFVSNKKLDLVLSDEIDETGI